MNNVSYFNFRKNRTTTSMNSSLIALNRLTKTLLEVLDRQPQHVVKNVISLTKNIAGQGSFLLVDEVIRLTRQINNHLDDVARHIAKEGLSEGDYVAHTSTGNRISLLEALQDKWDTITHKRINDNFLNQTFGSVFDEIGEKIHKIINHIPVHSMKKAA